MRLALYGGTPVRRTPFPKWPQYDDNERANLIRALDQGQWWRVGGSEVATFEQEFAAFHGAPAALAVSTGTCAVELALELVGLKPGDEVIVPAFTFIATSNAVQRLGAVPVPVDVDASTYCMDPQLLDGALTERTRAVIPVHIAGHIADMDAINGWAKHHGVAVIQDAANAHGGSWRGMRLGELGSLACFSFQNGKLMTSGEGGAVILPDADRYNEAFARHSCGRPIGDQAYQHLSPSSNLRMSEFCGAVLRAQLTRLAMQNERREARWKTLSAALSKLPGVAPQGRDPRCLINPHYMVMFTIDPEVWSRVNRDEIIAALIAEGIPAKVNYPPIYRTQAFWDGRQPARPVDTELAARCPHSEFVSAWGVHLKHYVLLGTDREVTDVADAVEKVLTELALS